MAKKIKVAEAAPTDLEEKIEVTTELEEKPEVIFVVSAEARNKDGTAILLEMSDGSFFAGKHDDPRLVGMEIKPYIPPPEVLPKLSAKQLRMWLLEDYDLFDEEIKDLVQSSTMNPKDKKRALIELEYGTEFDPDSNLIKILRESVILLSDEMFAVYWKTAREL